MKKIVKIILTLSCGFALIFATVMSVNAADYRLRRMSTASSSVGSATVYCTGVYYPSGATRWARSWEAYSGGTLKSASVKKSTFNVPSNDKMNSTVTVSMTTFDYRSGSGTRNLAFRFTGSAVVADN